MGICYDLYCVDCQEHYSLEKQSRSRWFIPMIMAKHKGHKLHIFNDVVFCIKEKTYKDFKHINIESFDTPENESMPQMSEEEFDKFQEEHSACDRCGGIKYPYCY